MMMTMSMANGPDLIELPPGFRFRPTDLELFVGYLQRKNLNLPLPCNVIKEIESNSYHPSEIGQLGEGDDKYYYFTRPEPNYPNGLQPNGVPKNGGWKASGRNPVCDSANNEVGTKKSLVFIDSEGHKTNWHMLEYNDSRKKNNWTLCCLYEKINAEEKKRQKVMAAVASSSQVDMTSKSISQVVVTTEEPANEHEHDHDQVIANQTLYEGLPNIVDLEPIDMMNDFDRPEF